MDRKKYSKLPAKTVEETPWNKICVYFIGPYKICRKGKDPIILKSLTMIDPITGCFEGTQYCDKKEMIITNLIETTCLVQYQWPVEITYDRGGEILSHEFLKWLDKK